MAFIMVSNGVFTGKYGMSTKELFVYSFLQIVARGEKDFFGFSMSHFIKNVENKEHCLIPKGSDKRTLAQTLDSLMERGFLENKTGESFATFKPNDLIFIKIKHFANAEDGFSQIDINLYLDYASRIGYLGWAIYLLLCRYYNSEKGCAYPSKNKLAEKLNSNRATISKYCDLLEELKLISIKRNSEYNFEVAKKEQLKNGDKLIGGLSDEYIVFSRIEGDKYYVKNE